MNTLADILLPGEIALLNGGEGAWNQESDGLLERHSEALEAMVQQRGPWLAAAVSSQTAGAPCIRPYRLGLWHSRLGPIIEGRAPFVPEESFAGNAVLSVGAGVESGPPEDAVNVRTGHDGRWLFMERASSSGSVRFRLDLTSDTVAGINVDWTLGESVRLDILIPLVVPEGAAVTIDNQLVLTAADESHRIRQRVAVAGGAPGAGYTLMIPSGAVGHARCVDSASGPCRAAMIRCDWQKAPPHGFTRFVVRVD